MRAKRIAHVAGSIPSPFFLGQLAAEILRARGGDDNAARQWRQREFCRRLTAAGVVIEGYTP